MLETPLRTHRESTVPRGRAALTVFHLGNELFAVDTSVVQEIIFMARLSRPNGLPRMIAGFLNLAQRPIPVLRLGRLLGLPESEPGLYTQILILRDSDGTPAGWMVDGVTQIISVSREEILPVPESHCFRDCAAGILTVNDQTVSILAADRILLEQERRCIVDFQAREQARLDEIGHPQS